MLRKRLADEKKILTQLEAYFEDALQEIDDHIALLIGRSDSDLPNIINRIEYQRMIKGQVQSALDKLHAKEYETIESYLEESYTDAFVGTMYSLHGQGVPIIAPIDQAVVVKAISIDTKLKDSLYKTLGMDLTKLKSTIAGRITTGIASGALYSDIQRNISDATRMPLSRARTIVRTEAGRVQEQANMDAAHKAQEKGADVVKQWCSVLDGKTRQNHMMLDKQIRELKEYFQVGTKKAMQPHDFGKPEEDCNCRCTMLIRARMALDTDELKAMQERAKFFGIDKTKDFEDYKKKYLGVVDADIDNKLSKPKRPKRSDYDDEDKYDEARAKYRKELETYKERLEKWADLQIPDTAMTRNQIEDWCSKNNLELKDIDGMDKRAFNAFTKRWEQLSNDYPLNKKLHFSTGEILDNRLEIAYENNASVYADAAHGMSFGSIFKDYRNVLKGFGEQMSDGFNVWGSGSINTLFDHEYGHSVYTSLKYAEGMTMEKRLKMKDDLIATCFGKNGISEYAQTNEEELFAEGFAAFYGGEKTEFAEAFKQFLGRWYK